MPDGASGILARERVKSPIVLTPLANLIFARIASNALRQQLLQLQRVDWSTALLIIIEIDVDVVALFFP